MNTNKGRSALDKPPLPFYSLTSPSLTQVSHPRYLPSPILPGPALLSPLLGYLLVAEYPSTILFEVSTENI